MEDISVFVATHVAFDLPTKESIYVPIQGGAELYPNKRFGYLLDNVGDNISLKKENYNELTSQFWAWKNNNSSIKGLCHYRRYLSKGGSIGKNILTSEDIKHWLSKYDVLLPYPLIHKGFTNREYIIQSNNVFESDLTELEKSIKKIHPDYFESYSEIMNRDYACYCNMLITKKNLFNEYSDWLFSILFETEKHIDLSGRNPSQIRLYGYLSELLLNVFLHHSKNSVKFFFTDLITDYNKVKKIKMKIKRSKPFIAIMYKKIDKGVL